MASADVNVVTNDITIPFQPSLANYSFGCAINDVTYLFEVRWNDRALAWYFSLAETDTTPIISGIKIVLGAYLGRQCSHDLFKGGVFVAVDTSGKEAEAGFDDMGVRVIVKYIPVLELIRRLS